MLNFIKKDQPNSYYRWISRCYAVILLAYIITSFIFPYISPDSGFYLKIAHDLANGVSFYKDLNVAYTPLGMYIYSVLFEFLPNPGFWILNSFVVIIYICNALLLNRILNNFMLDARLKLLLSLAYLIGFYILQGTHILLEQFVLLFQLLAVLLVLKWEKKNKRYLLWTIGCFCFCAFFTKQYGLSILPAIVYLIFKKQNRVLQLSSSYLNLALGFIFPFLMVFIYFTYYLNLPALDLLKRVAGIDVLAGEEVITGVNYSFNRFIESVLNFLIKAPLLILLIILLIKNRSWIKDIKAIFLLLLILGGSMQLIFASYAHYYQLILPFGILLLGYILQQQKSLDQASNWKLFVILSLITILSSTGWYLKDYKTLSHQTNEQAVNKNILMEHLPKGTKVYLEGILPPYYYINKFDSPAPVHLGYRFPEELSLDRISNNLPVDSYIILKPQSFKHAAFHSRYQLISEIELYANKRCVLLLKIKQ